ncbi:hypothetical protein NLJ89_g9629 [Agrocybe chaxingu]|uniref:Uncharacterized protein n=1 Tax=Agrocybe chaxingu TaxID=84603 RepID=A0A9W8JS29_9AGAR|nr:hypothetical protein NLJ89_g9629 [Agrocybe chaxingu]
MDTSFSRSTRSGRTFASWDSPAVIPNPDFETASLVQRAVALEQLSRPADDLFADMDPIPGRPCTTHGGRRLFPTPPMDGAIDNAAASSSTNAGSLPPPPIPSRRHLPIPSSPTLPTTISRKRRAMLQSRKNRKKREEAEKAKQRKFGGPAPRAKATQKHAQMAELLATPTTTKQTRHAEMGYTGLPDPKKEQAQRAYGLEELTEVHGFEVQPWDGKTPFPIVDREGTMMGVAIGHPEDKEWEQLHQHAAQCLEHARQRCNPVLSEDDMRRGEVLDMPVLESLNSESCFQRLASFTSSAFASWAPALHKYYCEELGKLQAHDPSLRRPFDSSVFMATTYNLGPQTVCFRHLDSRNLAFRWCAVTALGSFDPKKGGHLVLWECKLIIEFPPGLTILIPSALIHHSNTPIAEGETRYSFTQYASGGLFHWVDHGFQTVEAH